MKYYEINDPYYALIKAKDETSAYSIYVLEIAGDDEGRVMKSLKEVHIDYTLEKTIRSLIKEDVNADIGTMIDEINNEEELVLLIDGSLL